MLRKKMLRDIKLNLSQFITIFLMVFIGVLAYSGIESYMMGMQKTANKFYSENNLQDLNVIGANFTTKDLDDIKKIDHVNDAERKLSITATTDNDKTLLTNFIESNNISEFYIMKGEKFDVNKKGDVKKMQLIGNAKINQKNKNVKTKQNKRKRKRKKKKRKPALVKKPER